MDYLWNILQDILFLNSFPNISIQEKFYSDKCKFLSKYFRHWIFSKNWWLQWHYFYFFENISDQLTLKLHLLNWPWRCAHTQKDTSHMLYWRCTCAHAQLNCAHVQVECACGLKSEVLRCAYIYAQLKCTHAQLKCAFVQL